MKQMWCYKIVELERGIGGAGVHKFVLDDLGEKGWELVCVVINDGRQYAYMKQPGLGRLAQQREWDDEEEIYEQPSTD